MINDLDKNLIQKCKEFLKIDEEISSIELLRLLKQHRKRLHPDKFKDKIANKEAEEKFKELGNLIENLDKYIQNEKLTRGAKELALYEPLYDNISLESELEEAREKIEDLEFRIKHLEEVNKSLNSKLNSKENEKLKNELNELKALYKPTTKKLASLGILLFLSMSLAIITKIDDISFVLKKYSPINEVTLNNIIFIIFILVLIVTIKEFIEHKIISKKINEACSINFSNTFFNHLSNKNHWYSDSERFFSEQEVFNFIKGKDKKYKKMLSMMGFKFFHIETVEKLKDFFIRTMLNKKLIEISNAKNLDRTFRIKNDKYYY